MSWTAAPSQRAARRPRGSRAFILLLILLPIKIANLANMVEARDRTAGWQATCNMVIEMSGIDLSPALVEAWDGCAEKILAGVDGESSWDEVVGARSPGHTVLTTAQLDDALELLADFADLKSPWFTGHSRAVASLAVAAAKELRLPETDQVTLRRAGLLHDIGRTGVPNHLWDKPTTLTAAEFEKVRLHARSRGCRRGAGGRRPPRPAHPVRLCRAHAARGRGARPGGAGTHDQGDRGVARHRT